MAIRPRPNEFGLSDDPLERVAPLLRKRRAALAFALVFVAAPLAVFVGALRSGDGVVIAIFGAVLAAVFMRFVGVFLVLIPAAMFATLWTRVVWPRIRYPLAEVARNAAPPVGAWLTYRNALSLWKQTQAAEDAAAQARRRAFCARAHALVATERARIADAELQAGGLDDLSPREFEFAVARLYERLGYAVHVTPLVNDEGKDIVATRVGERLFIECKHFRAGVTVGRPHLQKLVGALPDSRTQAVCVTTSEFTGPARAYAAQRKVQLIDRPALGDLLRRAYGPPTAAKDVLVMCEECGAQQRVRLDGPAHVRCGAGHGLAFDPRAYRPAPATGRGPTPRG